MQFSMYYHVCFRFRFVSYYTDKRISKDKLVNSDLFHTVNNSVKSV